MARLPTPTLYSNHVASTLSKMGDFTQSHLWTPNPDSCSLTRKLHDATTKPKTSGRVTVRIAPLIVGAIIAVALFSPWNLYRQISQGPAAVDPYRVESMAECQYGCTGSDNYERCVVGCVEVATEDDCDAKILCHDCDLVYPKPHSLHDRCMLMCSDK